MEYQCKELKWQKTIFQQKKSTIDDSNIIFLLISTILIFDKNTVRFGCKVRQKFPNQQTLQTDAALFHSKDHF